MTKLLAQGINPLRTPCVINLDGVHAHAMVNMVPCLTAARAGQGGHWVTSRGRRLTSREMQALMGIVPDKLNTSMVKVGRFHRMLGNAMAVNVLERIFARLLPAAGIVCRDAFVDLDRWAMTEGQLAATSLLQPKS
jgi:hypothetical protein